MDDPIRPGDPVWVRAVGGDEHRAVACSAIEQTHTVCGRKIHDFPVVWVRVARDDGGWSEPIPWPAGYVQQTPTQEV
jgi:hypothetical protein